jgi:hypothetical protein
VPIEPGGSSSRGCQVPLFSAPKAVVLGESASINWRILDCPKAKLYENNTLLRELTPSGSDNTVAGSGSFAIQVPTTFKLNAVGSSGGESFLAQAYVEISKCSGGANFQSFTFCVNCITGGSKNIAIVTACTADEPEKTLKSEYGGCTISSGARQ